MRHPMFWNSLIFSRRLNTYIIISNSCKSSGGSSNSSLSSSSSRSNIGSSISSRKSGSGKAVAALVSMAEAVALVKEVAVCRLHFAVCRLQIAVCSSKNRVHIGIDGRSSVRSKRSCNLQIAVCRRIIRHTCWSPE